MVFKTHANSNVLVVDVLLKVIGHILVVKGLMRIFANGILYNTIT